MKRTNLTRNLTTALIASVAFSVPALASAQTYQNANTLYDDCKRSDSNNQVLGGVLGAVAGGLIGSRVAGRGDRNEGALIGGVLGSVAGVGIGNDQRHCTTESIKVSAGPGYNPGPVVSSGPVYSSGTTYNNGTSYNNGGTTYDGGTSTTYTQAPTYTQPHVQTQGRTVYTSPRVTTPTYASPTYITVLMGVLASKVRN